jgi:hypothetical protein
MAVMSTPAMQLNQQAIMALQGHIQEHIGLLAEAQAQQEVMSQIPPEQMQMIQQQAQMMQQQGQMGGPQGQQGQAPDPMEQFKPQIDSLAAQIIADLTEELVQAVTPPEQSDPLVDIRNQELQLKAADLQRKEAEFEAKQEFEREKEQNDVLTSQQRIDVSEAALADKTRIAENRIQTQRDIAALNSNTRNQ